MVLVLSLVGVLSFGFEYLLTPIQVVRSSIKLLWHPALLSGMNAVKV